MQLYGVLMIVVMTLSTACGLTCYSCVTTEPEHCTNTSICSGFLSRCFTLKKNGFIITGCHDSGLCSSPLDCCREDLCNSVIPTTTPTITTTPTASRLRCHTCVTTEPESCTQISTCPASLNRCFSLEVNGLITKGCQNSALCVGPMDCCEGDLCNSATPTASRLRCHTCVTTEPESCTQISTCPASLNRCFSLEVNGRITKGCQNRALCGGPMDCCEGDLCNSATPTASRLSCYTCDINHDFCIQRSTCPAIANRCFSIEVKGLFTKRIIKGCQNSALCVTSMDCCEGDLCNSAIPTVPSAILLLILSAIVPSHCS
ncbi:protein psiI-like [Trachinotus anak]|uniref:protein psiI-like n=1 Tax=Trachinotus anak TaxID=443729 RepID=UPI0039F25BDB